MSDAGRVFLRMAAVLHCPSFLSGSVQWSGGHCLPHCAWERFGTGEEFKFGHARCGDLVQPRATPKCSEVTTNSNSISAQVVAFWMTILELIAVDDCQVMLWVDFAASPKPRWSFLVCPCSVKGVWTPFASWRQKDSRVTDIKPFHLMMKTEWLPLA